MSKLLTKNLDFRGHLSTFRAQNTLKIRPFEAKNKAQTIPKQVQNNFEKVQKSTFLSPKWSKMTLSEGQILTKNLDFRGHLSTFRAENTPKSGPSKSKNNAQTHLKLLQNNFEKLQNFWLKFSFIRVIYQPFELKIQPKVGPLSSKLMPNHVLNKSKKNFEKVQNTTFSTIKMAKNDPSERPK